MKKVITILLATLILATCLVLIFNDSNQDCAGCIPCEYERFEQRVSVISIDHNLQDSTIRSVLLGESFDIDNGYIRLGSQELQNSKISDALKKASENPDIRLVVTGERITAGSCKPIMIKSLTVDQ